MPKVVVNYGHGENTYREKGSKGVTVNGVQYAEHTHNYQVGTRVKAHLERHGITVLETQPPNGRDVSLTDRINQANNWKADLYYSIHGNASGDPLARGWCGFYWNTSPEGKKIADLYAKEMKALGLPLYHNGIWGCIDGTWNAFQELKYTHMPAIIAENGFMTNAEDFKHIFLNVDNSWDKQAVAHAKAILAYFGIAYKEPVIMPTDRVTIHNTALWQSRSLVKEYTERGFKAYGYRVNDLPKTQFPSEQDAYKFIIDTDFKNAHALTIELQSKGYAVEWTTI